MDKKDIKNGNLVFDRDSDTYCRIQDVGNAIEKGDRNEHNLNKEELSYSIVEIISGKVHDGICENSGMTAQFLRLVSKQEVSMAFERLQAECTIKLGKAKRNLLDIEATIFEFNNKL